MTCSMFPRAVLIVATMALPSTIQASAQDVGKPIRIISAYAPGDSGDALARLVADRLAGRLGMPAVVENRPGASGRIGTKAVISAAPDGNTLLFSPMAPIVLHPITYTNIEYDTFKELAPISQLATFDISLTVGAKVPANSPGALVAWLKANPGEATYATPGLGGLPHFFAVMFATASGVQMRNVPYRGGAAVINDLLADQLPIMFGTSASTAELHQAGRVRILATSGRARSPHLPAVPTFKEAGYEIEGEGWYGLYAPGRTQQAIVDRLSTLARAVLAEADVRQRVLGLGLVPTGTDADQLARIQRTDRERWAPAVRESGFRPGD